MNEGLETLFEELKSQPSDINEHLQTLHDAAKSCTEQPGDPARRFPTFIELGAGRSTVGHLLALGEAGTLWTVDILGEAAYDHRSPEVLAELRKHKNWRIIVADSEVFGLMAGGVDYIFLDTSHTYNKTYGELKVWWSHLRDGGIIALHDTHPKNSEHKVMEALNDFLEDLSKHSLDKYERTEYENNNGLTVIKKIGLVDSRPVSELEFTRLAR